MTRLGRLARAAIMCVILLSLSGASTAAEGSTIDSPTTPIKHLIVLMQSSHSFDNYFGTYPGANGVQAGTCMPVDPSNKGNTDCVKPFHLGSNDVQLGNLDDSASTFQLQYNNGALNGFVSSLNQRNNDGRLAMGYYDDQDIPYYWNLASQYVLFDNFFSSAQGGALANHVYWVAGAPPKDDPTGANNLDYLTTIFDRLQQAGVSWKFYVQNYDPKLNYRTASNYPSNRASQVVSVPLLSFDRFIDDPSLSSHIVPLSQYYTDLANDTLPAVAYVSSSGPSEHPPSSIDSGERFVRSLVQTLMTSDSWRDSAFMLTYDDWGGWYDHVTPPQVDGNGYGFRVPTLLISPYAKQGYVDHTQLDFTSILKFIENNYQLQPLATRDASANSFADAFNFSRPPAPATFVSSGVAGTTSSATPRRHVIYFTYGFALLFTLLAFGSVVYMKNRPLVLPEDRWR